MGDEPVKVYFDREPPQHITAEQVRLRLGIMAPASLKTNLFRWVLEQLLTHPGVSSSARAVIEAALE